jgi:FixJ family two-component response regulator
MLLTDKSVYIVDDDPSVRTSMKRLLREHGFSAKLFESAGALLDHGEFSDASCLVLDINLNDCSGFALGQQLAAQGVKVAVVYITGNDSSQNRSTAIKSGCIAYLTKPFSAESFIDSIERACAEGA